MNKPSDLDQSMAFVALSFIVEAVTNCDHPKKPFSHNTFPIKKHSFLI